MSLALISQTYNFESDSEHGGEDSEDCDVDAEHEIEKKESDMAQVEGESPSECGIEGLVKVTELNYASKDTEEELEVPTMPSCPQSKRNRKRQKRVGNWMWSSKRKRSGRQKSKTRVNVAIHDQPCKSKDVLQIDQGTLTETDPLTGGGGSELAAHDLTDPISIINDIGPNNGTVITKVKLAEDHPEKLPTQHIGNVAKLKRYACNKCSTTFAHKPSLRRHIMRLHSKVGRPFKCSHNQCGCSFLAATHLQRHETIRHGIIHSSGKKCTICRKIFRNPSALKEHMELHKEATHRPWMCKLCPSFFIKLNHLRVHENRVHGRKAGRTAIPCEVCGKVFPHIKLIIHMRTHSDANGHNMKCAHCQSYFSTLTGLRRHETQYHGRPPGKSKFSCDVCNKVVSRPYKLASHMKHVHGKEVEVASALKFRSKTSASTRSGNKSGNVKHVIMNLAVESNNVNGTIQGERLKLHECTLCERSFPFLSYLKRHENRAHGRKEGQSSCPCKVCGRLIYSSTKLIAHMLTHADVKTFSCAKCGRKFRHRSNRDRHLRTVHASSTSTPNVKMINGSGLKKENCQSWLTMLNQLRPCKLVLTRCDDLLSKYRKEEISSKYISNSGEPSRKLVGRNSKTKKAKKSDPEKAMDNETERLSKSDQNEHACHYDGLSIASPSGNMSSGYLTPSQMETGHTPSNLTMSQIASKLITQRKKGMRAAMETGGLVPELESQICTNLGNGKSISPGDTESENITGHIPTPLIFNCPYCLESFEDAGLLIGHLPIHEEENTGREFIVESSEDQSNAKLETTDDQLSVSANDIQTVSETRSETGPELIKIEESKELLCPECEISFPTDRALRFHMRIHSEPVRTVKCRQCNVSFNTFKGLQIHDGRLHKVSKPGILPIIPMQGDPSSSSSSTVEVKLDEGVSEI